MNRFVWLAVLLTACDPGGVGDTAGDEAAVESVSIQGCDSGDTVCNESFGVASAGSGALHVTDGLIKNCCTDIAPSASLSGTTISLSYSETGEQCDCQCGHIADFDVTGLTAGEYTVLSPEGESASVTVE